MTSNLEFPYSSIWTMFSTIIRVLLCLAGLGNYVDVTAQNLNHSFTVTQQNFHTDSVSSGVVSVFHWGAGPWTQCSTLNRTLCGQSREIFCLYSGEAKRKIPYYFCDGILLLETYRSCDICPVDCVIGIWNEWSEWSSTCSGATRYRSRVVLRAPRFGGRACGELSQTERSQHQPDCKVELSVPTYKWRIGEWTSCRQPLSLPQNSCMVGQRYRRVDCVDSGGELVEDDFCLQSGQGDSENSLQTASFQPPSQEVCTVPCDCQVSLWTPWGECSVTCHDPQQQEVTGHRLRTRRVTRVASNGGLPCPPLEDHQPCLTQNLTACPRFHWFTQEWQACQVLQGNDTTCGAGVETRQVFCVREGSEELSPVDDHFCLGSSAASVSKPVSNRACYIDCPVHCEVGNWANWSPCSKSCGEGAVQQRNRDVLVQPNYDGNECPPLVQMRACEAIECAWWHTGRWTTCFLDYGYDDCGPGTRNRAVYCMNALKLRVSAGYCAGKPKPARQGTCRVPCAEDCVVSEWAEWGSCSVTCGPTGGLRTRTRQIVAYPFNRTLNRCLPEDQLIQTKPCNLHVSCDTYAWQVSSWGLCSSNGTATCGQAGGIQTRELTCEIESGVPADPTLCDPGSRPHSARLCDIPCPVDCELSPWSTWSSCSASCGLHARRTRTKHVLTLAAHGGDPCPPEANENGIITWHAPCPDIQPCYTYHWVVSAWSDCQVLVVQCGRGLQTRDVYCGRSDGLEAEAGLCLLDFTSPPPISTQRCYVPCAGDCLLSKWSDYGPCHPQCGTSNPVGYCRLRKREIVSVASSEDPGQLCPHIMASDLVEYVPCGLQAASYSWTFGTWTTCSLPNGLKCGSGIQRRVAICMRNDNTEVADLFCLATTPSKLLPVDERSCKVQCSIDCVVTVWSNWSSCSQGCGQGVRTRTRTVTTRPVQGGRACPLLTDTQICFDRSCDQLEWDVSEWSPCQPTNLRTNCGEGQRSRVVTCPAGPENEVHCQQRNPKPSESESCHLPCQGECVFSEWSSFTSCSTPCASGRKSRTRIVIRPDAELRPCQPLRETVSCTPGDCQVETYGLVTGEWSECQPGSGDCGTGARHRTLNCVNSAGVTVNMNLCQHQNITTHETCMVDCPIDCQLGDFTQWSKCSAPCGTDGVMYRTREIVTAPSGTGRPCQSVHNLNETKPCNAKPCFEYQWFRGNWSECQFDSKAGCGVGQQTRLVECQRSDGLTVDWEYCYLNAIEGATLDSWNQLSSGLNQTALDLNTTRQCQTWCPGDCVVSEWSQFTPCYGNCFNATGNGQQTRTRVITSPPATGGIPCTTHLINTRSCPDEDAVCRTFTWKVGQWDDTSRTREVWCEMEGGVVVVGGCPEDTKPTISLDCIPDCTSMGSYCDQGRCKCATGFAGDGSTCYPTSGCVTDVHCPFEHSMCSPERECVCKPGYFSSNGSMVCIAVDIPDSTSDVGIAVDDNDSDTSPYKGSRGTWKWIVGAVSVGIIILAIILCGALVHRYYHTGEIHFEPIPHGAQNSFRSSWKANGIKDTKC